MVRQGCYAGDVSYGVCESGLARGAGGRRKWLEKDERGMREWREGREKGEV